MILPIGAWIGIGVSCLFVSFILIWYIVWRIIEKSYKFNAYSTASEAINDMNLSGKVAIITGSNSGIGKESAKIMAMHGCTVIMACRSMNKGEDAITDIINELTGQSVLIRGESLEHTKLLDLESQNNIFLENLKNRLILMKLDLSSLQSVYEFAMALKTKLDNANNNNNIDGQPSIRHIDYLINNAGIMALREYCESKDGFELQFATNHLGHWYLTQLLLPHLKQYHTRIINISSIAQMFAQPHSRIMELFNHSIEKKDYMGDKKSEYDDYYNYGITKLCNLLHARSLYTKYWVSNGIMAVSVHPGTILSTNLIKDVKQTSNLKFWRKLMYPQYYWEEFKNIQQGAATTMLCVSMTNDEIKGGHFYLNCRSADDENGLYQTADDDKTKYHNILANKLEKLSKLLVESKGFKLTLE